MLVSTKPPKCKHCGKRTEALKQLLHSDCIEPWLAGHRKKQALKARKEQMAKAKVERVQIRERKDAVKKRSQWIAEAQQAVNKYVRLRDVYAGHGCISCGAKYELRYGGAFDAGHFRSVGSAPHLRFFLPQIRLQCVRCNRHLGGNAIAYRCGLVERIGVATVEQIEAMQGVAKWDVPYLRRLKSIMGKKARRLEKRHAV